MHPRRLRCSSLKYSRYSRSSRLAGGAPRPSRCDARLSPRAARATAASRDGEVPVSSLNQMKESGLDRVGQESGFLFADSRMRTLVAMAERAAACDSKVLITGESGVGKDLVARHIHTHADRASRPVVVVNCPGLTESLLESELFGHVKGSFTGAYRDKPGKLQIAERGTLFLDEVGEMSLRMQALLLRFLENGEIQAVGAHTIRTIVDVRVIAATNRNLNELIASGQFREDLL